MCGRKSKNGARSIAMLFLVLLLLASPCFAAASWAAWFASDTSLTGSQSASSLGQESSQTASTTQSKSQSSQTSVISSKQLQALQKELTAVQSELKASLDELEESKESLTRLEERLENLKQTEAISEAEYQSVKESLQLALPQNSEMADRIARLEAETGTKPYMLLGAFVGFENNLPVYGLSLDLGIRIGNSLMVQAGVEYEFGSIAGGMFDSFTSFSMDDLRFTAKIGWMW